MNKRKKNAIAALFIAVLAFCLFIFINSSLTAEQSSDISGIFSGAISRLLSMLGIAHTEYGVSFFVRKSAHFLGFSFIALLISMLIYKIKRSYTLLLLSLPICFAIALCDEFLIQASSAGRSPEWRDVLIDLCGALFAALLFALITYRKTKKGSETK